MPWKLGTKTINLGRNWVDASGNQYPTNWLSLTTDEEKKAVGLTWEADPTPFNNDFYWGWSSDGKTLIEKNIADTDAKDELGNLVKDENGNQVINQGLKSVWIAKTKKRARGLLSETDWYVIRKADTSTAIPTNVATYRTAVRTACANIETSITNAADHAAFMALWNVPVDSDGNSTGNSPIYDWPDPLE